MSQRITIDPVTRIEGHLRIDLEVEGGAVRKAWSSGTMWRGFEQILKGRDSNAITSPASSSSTIAEPRWLPCW